MKAIRNLSKHAEWLSMVEISGSFLAISILERIFPQGLDAVVTSRYRLLRSAYEEWQDAIDQNDPLLARIHQAWIRLVLVEILEFDDTVLFPFDKRMAELIYHPPGQSETFEPDFILRSGNGTVSLLISVQPAGTDLEKVKIGDGWPTSIVERMTLLCRFSGVRLGLITNGERWMIVNAPVGNISGHVSWYSRLWFQEPITFKAFQSLLNLRRWFGPREETLPSMLEESLQYHEEITDTLGEQVRRAVEVLVQCLDKADQDRNRELLRDVNASELYEAGLTVMMRLVFILCAEERELLLLGDPIYDQYYAVTNLRSQLAEEADRHGPEILERRHDAWSRLLAVFRAIYGGIEHETLRMSAMGGSLFDPDRFSFLEGRPKGTQWDKVSAKPLPIDNRTVLLLLNALQVLENRGSALLLSYRALDVEQIGHVYEGLLEYTVQRLSEVTLRLACSQKAKNPNFTLSHLESARMKGENALIQLIKEATQRSESAITNALGKNVDDETYGKIVVVCNGNMGLANRVRPFVHLLQTDAWGDFIVYPANSFAITLGADRRETGTHYTPKSLTENIVEKTLEPIVYMGPANGKPRNEWVLKSSSELLEIKVCDPAMGSGAFLVQVCRWLAERLVDAWKEEGNTGKFINVDGVVLDKPDGSESLPKSLDDQILIARRLVAEKCLYGVDLNPLAVELAKLSIWLITLAKGRPFGFLDHNLRQGDSLLGIYKIDQLTKLCMAPEKEHQLRIFSRDMEGTISEAIELRKKLRGTPIRDINDIQVMKYLDEETRRKLKTAEYIADAFIGNVLQSNGNKRALDERLNKLALLAANFLQGDKESERMILESSKEGLSSDLSQGKSPRKPFHWALEFPEVFVKEHQGFNAILGNPPFLGGTKLEGPFGKSWRGYIVEHIANGKTGVRGAADLCAYFFLRSFNLLTLNGHFGFLSTNSICQGDTRRIGLEQLIDNGAVITHAVKSMAWPGNASIEISIVNIYKGQWNSWVLLDKEKVKLITSQLTLDETVGDVQPLASLESFAFEGVKMIGDGFIISEDEAKTLIKSSSNNKDVIFPYLIGKDINARPEHNPSRWCINFFSYPISGKDAPSNYKGPFAENYISVLKIVEDRVKPERMKYEPTSSWNKTLKEKWWQYFWRPELYRAISKLERVLVRSRVSNIHILIFAPTNWIFSDATTVFAYDDMAHFALLQSSVHIAWIEQQASSMRNDLRYTPSSCFQTFVHPINLSQGCSKAGQSFYDFREKVLKETQIGLRQVYNLLNSEDVKEKLIVRLRELLCEMDYAVISDYGWNDLKLEHGFYKTKHGMRFTICEETQQVILGRLSKLNFESYQKEIQQAVDGKKSFKREGTDQTDLFNIADKVSLNK